MPVSGVERLTNGFERFLNKSELARGYVFITNDKRVEELFDLNNFEIDFDRHRFEGKRLDVSGRVHLPRSLLEAVGTDTKLRFQVTPAGVLRVRRC